MRGRLALLCAGVAVVCGCGVMDSISETKEEVKKSNANMSRLIEQGQAMGQKLDQSVAEVKKSNTNMGKLIEQGSTMSSLLRESVQTVEKTLTRMNTLVDQGETTGANLSASVKAVEASLAKMDQLATLSQKLADMTGEMKADVASSLAEVRKTREVSERLLEKSKETLELIKKQEDAILLQAIQALSSIVNDPTFENRYRIASARAVWELLLQHPDPRWYMLVATTFQMCRERAGNPYGDLCTNKMIGLHGSVAVGLGDIRKRIEEKIPPMILPFVAKFFAATPFDPDNFPLPPFSANVVWVQGFKPESAVPFHKYLIADESNSLYEPALAFLQFTRRALLDSLEDMAWDEAKGKPLPPFKLEAFSFRTKVVEAIQALPGLADPKLAEEIQRFHDRISAG